MKRMKKYIAMLLCVMTASMSVNALAASDDDIKAALTESITSANMKMKMEMGLEKISDDLKEAFGITGDELPSMSADYDIAMNASEDNLIMQMAMTAAVKMTGVPDGEIEAYMDMDMSDEKAPKFVYITKSADYDKYMVMDYSSVPGYEQLLDSMNTYSPEKLKEINDNIYAAVPDKKFKEKNGVYTMTLTDEEVKSVFESMMLNMEDVMIPVMSVVSTAQVTEEISDDFQITDEMRGEYEADVKKWLEALKGVQIFGKDAVVISASMDDDKHLKTMGFELKLDTNLYELMGAVSPLIEDMDEETEEFIKALKKDSSDITAYLKMDIDMSNVNGEVDVTMPELTEDNTIRLEDMMIDEEKINVLYNGIRVKFDDVEPIIENDRTLVPLRKFCNVIGISDENITYEDGVITIKNGDTTLVLTIDNDKVQKTVGEVDTETIELDVPATIRNDRTLVPLRFVSENFNCQVEYEKLEDNPGAVIYIYSLPEAE